MPEISGEIVAAAADAMRQIGRKDPWLGVPVEDTARAALEAGLPLLRAEIAGLIMAQKQPCPVFFHRWFLRPSCWHCGRNGAFHRAARIAAGTDVT